MKIYIASPFFNEEELNFVKRIENVLEYNGISFYSPRLDGILKDMPKEQRMKATKTIYDNNVKNIITTDMMVAVIDNRDVGTMFEIGYAAALGKKIITLTNNDFMVNVMLKECVFTHLTDVNKLPDAVHSAIMDEEIEGANFKDVY